jgi:cytochrome c
MKNVVSALLFGAALLAAPTAYAADAATPDEAKALAIKAADYLKTAGPDKAFPEFDAKDGPWHDRDLYVTVQDSKGVMVAHGANPGLIGKQVLELKDVDGKPFNRDIQAIKDAGWIDFKWQNPLTKAVEKKTAYEIRVNDYIVGVGAYAK